jgi:hypothetical protein
MALIPYPDPGTIDEAGRAAIDHFANEHGRPTLLRIMLSYSSPAQQAMRSRSWARHACAKGSGGSVSRHR